MTGYGVPAGTDGVSIVAGSRGSPGVPATTGPRSATSMATSSRGSRRASKTARESKTPARASTSGNVTGSRSLGRTATPPVSRYGAPTCCHATSSAAWSKCRSVVEGEGPDRGGRHQDEQDGAGAAAAGGPAHREDRDEVAASAGQPAEQADREGQQADEDQAGGQARRGPGPRR